MGIDKSDRTGLFCPTNAQEGQKATKRTARWAASEEDGREAGLRTGKTRLHAIRSSVGARDRSSDVQAPSPRTIILSSVGERAGRRRRCFASVATETRQEAGFVWRRDDDPVWSKQLERRKNRSSLDDRACRAPELGQRVAERFACLPQLPRSPDRSAQNQNSRLNLGRAVTLRLGDNSAAAHPIARGIEQAAGRGG